MLRNVGGGAQAIHLAVVLLGTVLCGAVLPAGCSRKAISRPPDGGDALDVAGAAVDGSAGQGGGDASDASDVSDVSDTSDASDADTAPIDGRDGADANPDGDAATAVATSIELTPASQIVALAASGAALSGMATFRATGHFSDGHTEDITERATWPASAFASLRVNAGVVTVTAPGTYTVSASLDGVTGNATLVATAVASLFAPGFPVTSATVLDGMPAGTTTIAYPLAGAVIPPNLAPLQVHIARSIPAQTIARLSFSSSNVLAVDYYATCQPGAGTGCYVDVPAEVSQLFIAASESHDITLAARVGGAGAPLVEAAAINLAWANVPLTGAIYYWTSVAGGVIPGYTPPHDTAGTPVAGSVIQRYDLRRAGTARPELVYTDQGPPPAFLGSPPATATGATCVGCHSLSGDGKTMALTVGGSDAPDIALLDLSTMAFTVLDAPASAGATGPSDPNFYKQFRRSGIATETTFGPNGDVMVNMYRSQLFLRGTTASLASQGRVAPSWGEYMSDPFWSRSGKLFVFTSFATPDVGTYNSTGLNGDMKRGGQIAIATASATAINDDARALVAREANVTKFYPAVSDDDKLVVFDQSACGLDPDVYTSLGTPQINVYGSQTCDGYDDSTASLWITTPTGSRPVRLDNLNAGMANDNSHAKWAPASGLFRGRRLYWLVFSSRRPYGLQVNGGTPLSTQPQLWLGAVLIDSVLAGDPSFPPVWLPNQNLVAPGGVPNQVPGDNHTPQWAPVAVPIPG